MLRLRRLLARLLALGAFGALSLFGTFGALAPLSASAHELQPGFLELRESAPGVYDVLWKLPSLGESAQARMPMVPLFPPRCRQVGEAQSARSGTAWIDTARIECAGGLAGQRLVIEGLAAFSTDVLVRVQHGDGFVETHVVKPLQPSVVLRAGGDARRGAGAYLYLGVEHILLGVDHLLFVLGLLLIVRERRTLVLTITAFTVAHSLTLAAATFGVAQVPPGPLNAAIALSILFLGLEVARVWRHETSLTIRHPWLVAFGFGLLHGFGFASGLAQLGLPASEIPLALLLFNLGVEAGQLAFVCAVLLLERAWSILRLDWPLLVQRLPGYAVGTLGAYWTIQRVVMLLRGVS